MVERMLACVTFGLTTPGVGTGSARIALVPLGVTAAENTTTARDEATAMRRSTAVTRLDIRPTLGSAFRRRKTLLLPCPSEAVGSPDMDEIAVRPQGPYSLALSARLASDATRRVRDGLVIARCRGSVARAWQSRDGIVTIRSESLDAAEKLRWVLALDDDHSEFLQRFRDDPLLSRALKHFAGYGRCARPRSRKRCCARSAASSSTRRRRAPTSAA